MRALLAFVCATGASLCASAWAGESDELQVGDRFTRVLKLSSDVDGNYPLREIWGEVHFEARPDVPHAGFIDRVRALSTPETFRPDDFPWIIRLTAVEHLIRHRLYLKSLLVAYGVTNRDFRLPSVIGTIFPAERFPEFDAYAEELKRFPEAGEGVELKAEFSKILLDSFEKVDALDREWKLSTGPLAELMAAKRARAMAEAPRILDVGFRDGHLSLPRNLFERIRSLPSHGEGKNRSALEKEISKSLLFALSENESALETLANAKVESEIDVLFDCDSLLALTISRYSEFKPSFRIGFQAWNDRINRRHKKKRKQLFTSSAVSGGLIFVGFVAPYVRASLGLARVASLAGTAMIGVEGWKNYWKAYADWSLRRATFAGAELLLSPQEYVAARAAYGEEVVASLSTAVFFLPGLAAWGRGVALFQGGAKGLSRILTTLDRYALEKVGASRLTQWRGRIARYSIDRVERKLYQTLRKGSSLELSEARAALARRPVAFHGLQYHWIEELPGAIAKTRSRFPPLWPFRGDAIDDSLREVKRIGRAFAGEGEGISGLWRQTMTSFKDSLRSRANREMAITFISTNTIMKFAIESLIRKGDIWEDERLFGMIPLPRKGILINITIGDTVLGAMAFASHIQNPFLKVLPSALVTGGITALAQNGYTEHVDRGRVGAEMLYNVLAVWFTVPAQIRLADYLQHLPRTTGLSYLAYRTSWAATGYVVSGAHSSLMLQYFENGAEKKDFYGNYYRPKEDQLAYRFPKGAYAKAPKS